MSDGPECKVNVLGTSPDVEVWLDTGEQVHDGLCIGSGPTRSDALLNAKRSLDYATKQLYEAWMEMFK